MNIQREAFRELAKMIVDVVNEESNDYDAVESVQDILIAVLPKIEEE
jgi:hypothetical protein